MPRYAIKVEYHGGPFSGWQRQSGQPSVQEAIETALKKLEPDAPGIAAATILGDGQIALILDPSDIISHAASRQVPRRQVLEEIRT